ADPIVQDPTDTQSLNRYTYVGNNPLSYTDPTGYFSLGKLLRTIIAIVIVVVAAIYGQYWVAGAGLAAEGSTAAYAIAGAIGGAIAGGITGGDLRSVLVGAVSGAAFSGLGAAAKAGQISATQHVVAAGMTGGVTSVAQGGNFQSGFLAAGFSAIASPYIDSVANDNIIVGATASAAIGGTASVLGGGKFANGAVTGAFAYALGRGLTPANDNQASGEYQVAANDNGTMCDACIENYNWGRGTATAVSEMTLGEFLSGSIDLLLKHPGSYLIGGGAASVAVRAGGKGLQLVRGGLAARAGALTVDSNKIAHIFGQARHNLDPLVQKMGSQEAVFRAVHNATQAAVRNQGLTGQYQTTVNIVGQRVVVTGKVINGTARIGTFYIR
ncbi:MAG: hypothetical protein Q8S60_01935, partial [Parvibaculum sp.]|nr:hypothetical protein [Parvibaculum sp.]